MSPLPVTSMVPPCRVVCVPASLSGAMRPGTTWYVSTVVRRPFGSFIAASSVALSRAANASLVGAKTVMSSVVLRVSPRPAAVTAVTSVERAGLFDAAVATGSWAMPLKLPLPVVGTPAQAEPNGASADMDSGAMDSGAIDSGAIEAAMDSGAIEADMEADGTAVVVAPPPDEHAPITKAAPITRLPT